MKSRKERENMSEAKPKIEGAKKFCPSMRAAGQPTKKEFVTKVLELKVTTLTSETRNTRPSTRRPSMR
jgi:hypothetical protein